MGYYIFQPPQTNDPADAKSIAGGFSWLALGSPTVWSLRHGLWELVIANFMLAMVIAQSVPPQSAGMILIIWHASFGMLAGDIHARFLKWRAYTLMDYIPHADSSEAAFIQWVYSR